MDVSIFTQGGKGKVTIEDNKGSEITGRFTTFRLRIGGDEVVIYDEGNLEVLQEMHKALHQYLVSEGGK